MASPSHLAIRLIHRLQTLRPDWLPNDAATRKVLLTLWGSPAFVRRHLSLTLVRLKPLQPGVDVELLLEDTAAAGEGGRRPTSTEAATNQAMAGVKISAGLTDTMHWDEPALILDCLLTCAK